MMPMPSATVYEHGGLTELTPKGSTADAAFGNGFKIAGCMELNKKAIGAEVHF
jgi:hypothetical protein